MSYLKLENINKGYSDGAVFTNVLKDINLEVRESEFLAIVGFTGSGKTTLISMLAGLIAPDSGSVTVRGKSIEEPGRDRALVFQNYSLLPWLTVLGNVAIAVKEVFPKWSRAKRKEYSLKFIDKVGLSSAYMKYPSELSGGMKQRVSVARALAMDPEILLLDEPLSALDALTRGSLQEEIASIWAQDKKTVVLITNDVDEAILLADRIIPLTPGPNACLGPEFEVNIPRPRDKKELNHNTDFINLRNSITNYLIGFNKELNAHNSTEKYILPQLEPKDFQTRIYGQKVYKRNA